MTTNRYFSYKVPSEQNLYEDLIIEALQFYGQDVYYLPREVVSLNSIFQDDIPSKFSNAYKVEMYIDNYDGFAGEGQLFQKFGIEIRDQATFVVSRKRWRQTVATYDNKINSDEPREGDLVYLPLSKSLFQIMLVQKENPFYQISQLPTYRLECELFEYSDEIFDTDVEEIDQVETLGYAYRLQLDSDSDGITAVVGDTVTQNLGGGITVSGEVIEWDRARQVLYVGHISTSDGKFHPFTESGQITSAKTNAVRSIVSVLEDLGDFPYQNDVFDSDVDYISFDESNPFGDPR